MERRKREVAQCLLNYAARTAHMTVSLLITVIAYQFFSKIAYSERGYEAIGGEGLAAVLVGAFAFYVLSYVDFHIRKTAETKEDTI